MKLLAVSGSLRAGSSNTALLRAVAALAPAEVEVALYEGLAELPHFSPELDYGFTPALGEGGSPPPVTDLRTQVQAADGVLFCTPEYAFGMSGSLKNALDWLVSSGELWRKPVAVISASPSASGGEKAHAALLLTLTALEAEIVTAGSLTIPFVRTKLNANGDVTDPAMVEALRSALRALRQAAEMRQRELAG